MKTPDIHPEIDTIVLIRSLHASVDEQGFHLAVPVRFECCVHLEVSDDTLSGARNYVFIYSLN